MAKLGFFIPRTLSSALSTQREDDPNPFYVPGADEGYSINADQTLRQRLGRSRSGDTLPQRVVRIGRSIIPSGHASASTSRATSTVRVPASSGAGNASVDKLADRGVGENGPQVEREIQRTIRFPDEEHASRPS